MPFKDTKVINLNEALTKYNVAVNNDKVLEVSRMANKYGIRYNYNSIFT
ncbi:hypothetical protein [Chryseosolibacter indicus]|uniref:Transposase n=1 Tax=Chryseosolibacter indicus TaxID=2782351 RepID=A0ABS5VYC0_9BACT|nr:hypothetical protein [Chryseosolibacter indicus]MBT1706398.1 hypothetical protein [Chryseosolibacter indicus]